MEDPGDGIYEALQRLQALFQAAGLEPLSGLVLKSPEERLKLQRLFRSKLVSDHRSVVGGQTTLGGVDILVERSRHAH